MENNRENNRENNHSNAAKAASGFLWRLLEQFGAKGVTFVVSILLARLLDPTAYGTVALVMVFTNLLQIFVDSGLGNALIQKKNADDLDFSTVFFFNIGMCVALYILMYLCAPLIASFYDKPELTSLVRVMSLLLIISGVKNIQQAYVSRHMLFRKFFFSTLGGTLGAAVVGVYLAYRGYGVWAIVAQNLFNQFVDTVILWITVRWRPKKCYSWKRLGGLLGYGWKLLVSSLLDVGYTELQSLIIGKKYTDAELANYKKGSEFPSMLVSNINASIDSVLLPMLAREQDSAKRVREMTRRSIRVSSYLIWPLMVGLGVCAQPLVRLLLTEKWMECVPFVRMFCFVYAFYPIHTANLSAIKAMGRSDLFLRMEVLKKCAGIAVIGVSMWFGVRAMAYGMIFSSILSQIVNAYPNRKLLDYGYLAQLADILPSIALSAGMGAAVYCVGLLGLGDIATLCIQIPLGGLIYIGGSTLLRLETFTYLRGAARRYLSRRKK